MVQTQYVANIRKKEDFKKKNTKNMPSTLSNPLRLGLRQERVIPPQCLVIFGASGDLTHRKLIPA